jgi:hypothetical protein
VRSAGVAQAAKLKHWLFEGALVLGYVTIFTVFAVTGGW